MSSDTSFTIQHFDNTASTFNINKLNKDLKMLDFATQLTLDSIWDEYVALSIINSNLNNNNNNI